MLTDLIYETFNDSDQKKCEIGEFNPPKPPPDPNPDGKDGKKWLY